MRRPFSPISAPTPRALASSPPPRTRTRTHTPPHPSGFSAFSLVAAFYPPYRPSIATPSPLTRRCCLLLRCCSLGAGLGVALLALLMWGWFAMFAFPSFMFSQVYALAGSVIFSLYVVYDTWLITQCVLACTPPPSPTRVAPTVSQGLCLKAAETVSFVLSPVSPHQFRHTSFASPVSPHPSRHRTLSYDEYIVGAINLYLDFINLFLMILRLLTTGARE